MYWGDGDRQILQDNLRIEIQYRRERAAFASCGGFTERGREGEREVEVVKLTLTFSATGCPTFQDFKFQKLHTKTFFSSIPFSWVELVEGDTIFAVPPFMIDHK